MFGSSQRAKLSAILILVLAFGFFAFSAFKNPNVFLGSVQNLYSFEWSANVETSPEDIDEDTVNELSYIDTNSVTHRKTLFGASRKIWAKKIDEQTIRQFVHHAQPEYKEDDMYDEDRFRLWFFSLVIDVSQPWDEAEIHLILPRGYNTFAWKYYVVSNDAFIDMTHNVTYDSTQMNWFEVTTMTLQIEDGSKYDLDGLKNGSVVHFGGPKFLK